MDEMDLATAVLQLQQARLDNVVLAAKNVTLANQGAMLAAKVERLEDELAALRATGSGKTQPAPPPAKARPRDSKATT